MKLSERLQALSDRDMAQAQSLRSEEQALVEAEIVDLNQPDNVPNDVWQLIQENGRLATERLNELLNSYKFHRLKASDQAKLIQLAQDRAYGKAAPGIKRVEKTVNHELSDQTAAALRRAETRMHLPEYQRTTPTSNEDDPT